MLFLGLSLATALWSGVQAVNAEARASYDRAAAMLGGDRLPQIVAADGSSIPQADYIALRRGGWLVSPPSKATSVSVPGVCTSSVSILSACRRVPGRLTSAKAVTLLPSHRRPVSWS